jgi:hypothetical protein
MSPNPLEHFGVVLFELKESISPSGLLSPSCSGVAEDFGYAGLAAIAPDCDHPRAFEDHLLDLGSGRLDVFDLD